MAHELAQMRDGRWTMARADGTEMEWHGKANIVARDAPRSVWVDSSGYDFSIERTPVRFQTEDFTIPYQEFHGQHVLFRSDTHAPLSIVSEDYHIVQPADIMDFFFETCAKNGLTLDTAGVIRGGLKYWALASTGNAATIAGQDLVKQYILLATSVDGSMATVAKHTNFRVVCSNTFHASINSSETAIRVRHNRQFDKTQIALDLGLLDTEFNEFSEAATELHNMKMTLQEARTFYAELISNAKAAMLEEEVVEFFEGSRTGKQVWNSYINGPGNEQTMWGVFNGVTHMVDHTRGREPSTSMDSAWFGQGASLKSKAWNKAMAVLCGTDI